jgi:hypothetical protein
LLPVLLAVFCSSANSAGKVIFRQDFQECKDETDLKELGWRVEASPRQSTYRVSGGRLQITCFNNKFNGGYAEIAVPVCRSGILEFDAVNAAEGAVNARGLGLTLDIYNISTFWHDYCADWRRYFPEPTAKRIAGFKVEPVGHRPIAKISKGAWHHYKICFDTDKDIVEYYVDDMIDPAYVDADVPVLGRSEYQGGRLRIGSMGTMNGPVVSFIDNIVLTSMDEQHKDNR